ncbi:4'-phosphopantetheinyl transferase family protein [Rhizobium sp. C4]|uniref:4'-phosphopantetheinyl transferase family protein n=1 Tax=Rhizobium sp. C4 TaxID=1349800 RepID=UPI001E4B2336|nr:4'-phosphopantetheinyl transferase superfamily protein [Rhizobium sp. C4]MCD2173439.1 4'-phosphopantetheinyl transferase [Rhizobium sp. C4]
MAGRPLRDALAPLLPPAIRLACRAIRPGDRALLLPEEAATIPFRKDHMRDASGAARHAARELLAEVGLAGTPILKAAGGAPVWPRGLIGSLAHDDDMAVATIASAATFAGLGIDVEPAEPLAQEVAQIVRTAGDVLDGVDEHLANRLLFAAKEAVYKAVFLRDQIILGFEDVAIDFTRGEGRTRAGRCVQLVYCLRPRIVVVAFEPA